MTYKSLLSVFYIALLLISCGSNNSNKKSDFSIMTNAKSNKIVLGDTLSLSIINSKNHEIKSISYQISGAPISENEVMDTEKLGKQTIEGTIAYNDEQETVKKTIVVLNNEKPKVYAYNIVNEYPHDITSYTQGLEFYNGKLYESTGQYKESKLRIVNYETGEVLKNVNLADNYFAEGITIVNDKIHQLTWREKIGFVYNTETLEKEGSFKYGHSKEGWGLAHDGNVIYQSDGTENIYRLDPETLAVKDNIQVYTNKGKIIGINELEWVNGKLYANRYQKDGVAIINPSNGAVEGVIDFSPLKKLVTQHDKLDVLNGIAFNPETNTLFVTGKKWDKLFEVEILEKQ
ncbi:MAG: glutaminyl-peptide cyclotransferase [Flavobacteriaceae bacterium]|nr:glutaminyl-peptide cyclotransferase [Flavobacteriaceae bacterium]